MFQLSLGEAEIVSPLRSQFVILKRGHNIKYTPYVFTGHGAVMLANVIRSPGTVQTSIQIVSRFEEEVNSLKHAALQPLHGKFRSIGHGHDCHDSRLHRVRHH